MGSRKYKTAFLLLGLFMGMANCLGQDSLLLGYIRTGIQNNHAMQQEQANYQKSLLALEVAKSMFYPNLSFNARYSVAEGGREVPLPVGDLLNPVYQNLNQINDQLHGDLPPALQPDDYPTIDNETIRFLRPTEHETKIRLVQPLFNHQIYLNKQVKEQLNQAEGAKLEAFKRQLVADIKKAYYDYLKSVEALRIIEDNMSLLEENARVNKKLFENHKITRDKVYRSEARIANLKQEKASVLQQHKTAKAYFNFLLNRPLETRIDTLETLSFPLVSRGQGEAIEKALQDREEIRRLDNYINAADKKVDLKQFNALPTITTVIDYGFQGETYEFTKEYDFAMASVILSWDLFKGLKNRQEIEQAKLDKAIAESRKAETGQKIRLDVIRSYYALEAARQAVLSARQELKASKKAFGVVRQTYRQGQANMLEYLDAHAAYSNARNNLNIKKYDLHKSWADLERAACLFDLSLVEINN